MADNNTKHIQLLTVSALTAGFNTPSSRFRIRQYIDRLAEHNVIVREHLPLFDNTRYLPGPLKVMPRIGGIVRSRDADLVWIGKGFVQGYETFERFIRRPRILDVDDAVWFRKPFGPFVVPRIAGAMDAVIAGNSYLAEYFNRYCKKVYVVPTAIDLNRYTLRPDTTSGPSDKFVVGWTGLACNYNCLDTIEPVLDRFLREHAQAELLLISNRPWNCKLLAKAKVRFIQWSREKEVSALYLMSVGIMPLLDNKWSLGKCSFKMLQYMAVGLPVIVSPTGMNGKILEKGNVGFAAGSPEQWYEALESLYEDWSLGVKLGLAGRKVVEQFYDADRIADKLAEIFKSVAGR